MVRKAVAAGLSLFLVLLSPGLEAYAQSAKLIPRAGVRPVSPRLALPKRPGTAPAASLLARPRPAVAAQAAAPAPDAPAPRRRALARLALPSPLARLPAEAGAEARAGAAHQDFSLRLGHASRSQPLPDQAVSAPIQERRKAAGWLSGLSRSERSRRKARGTEIVRPLPPRSSWAPVGLAAAVSASLPLALAAFALTGAGTLVLAAGALTAAAWSWAVGDFIEARRALARGRLVAPRAFFRFVQDKARRGELSPAQAELLKPFSPRADRPWDTTLAYSFGGQVFVRPELIRTPGLFDRVIANQFAALSQAGPRGPPALASLRARLWELAPRRLLARFKVAALERAFRKTGATLQHDEPFDVLLVNPASDDLKNPAVYRGLSGGRARLETIAEKDPAKALDRIKTEASYGALVLEGADAMLPEKGSGRARLLLKAVRQLQGLRVLAERGIAQTSLFSESSGESRRFDALAALAAEAANEKSGAEARPAQDKFREAFGRFADDIINTRVQGTSFGRAVGRLYDGVRHNGLAILSFKADDYGIEAWETVARFWRAADGGGWRAARVDQEDGGHLLVLFKAEDRVSIKLRSRAKVIPKSFWNAGNDSAQAKAAMKMLEDAGFKDVLDKFRPLGLEIRSVIGADAGAQEIFATIPRPHLQALRGMVGSSDFELESEVTGVQTHLSDVGRLQNFGPVWKAGHHGRGEEIVLIDTGADTAHPRLAGRTRVIDLSGTGTQDNDGHGSVTSGIAISNDSTYRGMLREAVALVVKIFGSNSTGAGEGEVKSGAGIAWERGAILNASVGVRGNSRGPIASFISNLTLRKNAQGDYLIAFASAGNGGPFDRTLSEPGAGENVFAAASAAKSEDDGIPEISMFEAAGPDVEETQFGERWRDKPDGTLVGGDIVTPPNSMDPYTQGITAPRSKDRPASPADSPDGLWTRLAGTSMAAPVAAALGLLVKLILKATGQLAPGSWLHENLAFAVKAMIQKPSADMGVPLWFQGAGFVDAWATIKLAYAGKGNPEAWKWIERLKAVRELEDRAYQAGEIAYQEAVSRGVGSAELEASGSEGAPPDGKTALEHAEQVFLEARRASLPKLLQALRDPEWLIRRKAALVLLNFKLSDSIASLAQAAEDEDARVRQVALLALGRHAGPEAAASLKSLAASPRLDVRLYAAMGLARHKDLSGQDQLLEATRHPDKRVRYTAAWLLGQSPETAVAAGSERLAEMAADEKERNNIRHLAVAALFNIVSVNAAAISDAAVLDLLRASGPQNLGLTRTVSRFFPIAAARQPLAERLKGGALRDGIADWILLNRSAVNRPGALGELVKLLAGHLGISLETPTPPVRSDGAGVPGVDPELGPIDLIVEREAGAAPDARLVEEIAGGFGARLEAVLPLARSVWLSAPERKLYALELALGRAGFRLRRASAQFPAASGQAPGVSWSRGARGVRVLQVNAPNARGVSEAWVMAELERAFASVEDPRRAPLVVSLGTMGLGSRATPLGRLVNQLSLHDVAVLAPAGNEGPSRHSVLAPANAGLALAIGAVNESGALEKYSSRGSDALPRIAWAHRGELDGRVGTGAAVERSAEGLAALGGRLLALYGDEPLPRGFWRYLAEEARGSALAPDFEGAARRIDRGQAEERSARLSAQAESRWGRPRPYERPERSAPAPADPASVKELRAVLGDGRKAGGGTKPFEFTGGFAARSAGIEGFLYSKRELARDGRLDLAQLPDYFRYLDGLLDGSAWAAPLRESLARLGREDLPAPEKNARLDAVLADAVRDLQARLAVLDQTRWARRAAIYMILARAYNRLKPGKAFFDSIDDEELARIRTETRANALWLMDIYEIGEANRWENEPGAGGSPYSVKGYKIKAELGGETGFKALVARAKKAGFRIVVDDIVNHVSLDSEQAMAAPETLVHVVPPQRLSDEEIMAQVPKHNGRPVYYLVRTPNYPEGGRRVFRRILVRHPMAEMGPRVEDWDMWVDLAQRDFSQPGARDWAGREMKRLYTELGVDMVRRDMSYEVLNARYFPRWLMLLGRDRDQSSGWMREEVERFSAGFKKRWEALGDAEYHEESTDAVRRERPDAAMVDEIYANRDEMSRSGSNATYNKVGLYDALVSRDAGRIDEALRDLAFRRWQQGGAAYLNFIGTHDGGEGNPVDKFGKAFPAAMALALLFRPTLIYNGLELGVGQTEKLIGDLSKSKDAAKDIPFDIKVKINWGALNPANRDLLRRVWAKGEEHLDLLSGGAMEVLERTSPGSVVAASIGGAGGKALLVASNLAEERSGGWFSFAKPVLGGFGSFQPRPDRRYRLTDVAGETPVVYERDGEELASKGLYVELDGGRFHLFEIEEILADAPPTGPPASFKKAEAPAPAAAPARSLWDRFTSSFLALANVFFIPLSLPQIRTNYLSPAAEVVKVPWMGWSTGILGNMLLLNFFVKSGNWGAALVQLVGVLGSTVVVSQVFLAKIALGGLLAAWPAAILFPAILAGLAFNLLKALGRLPDRVWNWWEKASAGLGLAVLPYVVWGTFGPWGLLAGICAALVFKSFLSDLNYGAWTGTLLFMFMPLAALWGGFMDHTSMGMVNLTTHLLGMAGNLVMLPRAIYEAVVKKSYAWAVGSAWGVGGGLAILAMMMAFGYASPLLVVPALVLIPLYLGFAWLRARAERR